ncbi:MAG: iron ABC transporter permease [Candidatus Moduliflexus flocculans]|nr:iron ABC transporter permease [Candidatus Moduliflexus flocculans]
MAIALLLSLAIGSVFISPGELWDVILGNGTEISTSILWKIRLPRTVLIALAGAALGGSGAAYQGLFRNPLADPFLIGVASGAGLGAVIAMSVQWPYSLWDCMAIPMAAFLAALADGLSLFTRSPASGRPSRPPTWSWRVWPSPPSPHRSPLS